MSAYTQFFNWIPADGSTPGPCAAGTCVYFPNSLLGYGFLGYGHHVTVTILASDALPSRVGVYSLTGGEFAIDFNPPVVGHSSSHDFPLTDTYIGIELQPNTGWNFNVRIDYDLAPGETAGDDFCAYGTRVQAGVQNAEVITEALVGATAILVPELSWAVVALGALIGYTWVPGNICSGPPPSIPHFDATDFIAGTDIPLPGTFAKLLTLFEAVNWGRVCECTPAPIGHPPPNPPPPPTSGHQPGGSANPPVPLVCDNTDVCSTLNRLEAEVLAISGAVGRVGLAVQLIQRQGVPFGYLQGSIHSALVGQGDFAVSDVLGLAISFSAIPPAHLSRGADPDIYHQVGSISLGTIDGWERSFQPTHSPYLILGISGAVTKVGWTFADGVIASITELVREP